VISEFLGKLPAVAQSQIITLDGKTIRGSITEEDRFGVHLLAAYLPEAGIVLKQLSVEKEKENEIVVAPQLLESLNLEEKVVVGDAMQTQRALSSQIVDAGGITFGLRKTINRKHGKPLSYCLHPKSQCAAKGVRQWILSQPKPMKKSMVVWKKERLPSAVC